MRRPDGSTLFLWLVLIPAGVLAALMVVIIFTVMPGGSLLIAAECFRNASCETASMVRGGPVFHGHATGAAAYFYGALLVSLALVMASVVVTETPGLSSLTTHKVNGRERTRYGPAFFGLLLGFLILDTALVQLVAWLTGS